MRKEPNDHKTSLFYILSPTGTRMKTSSWQKLLEQCATAFTWISLTNRAQRHAIGPSSIVYPSITDRLTGIDMS